jgi:signal transduction histidine kinase
MYRYTKHQKTGIELLKAKEHEESDRLKSAFLANMSHDTHSNEWYSRVCRFIERTGLTGEMQQEYVSIIEESGVRMLNIINDIVDISK